MEEMLSRFTDLTRFQLECLHLAARGELTRINGATREAMSVMITPELQVTDHGRRVLALAERILAGDYQPECRPVRDLLPVVLARRLREVSGHDWIRSVHAKVLVGLYQVPGEAFGWLAKMYGHTVVQQLLRGGLVEGETIKGAPFRLTAAGTQALEGAGVTLDDGQERGQDGR